LQDLVLEPYNTIHFKQEVKRRAVDACPTVAAKRAEQLTRIYLSPPKWAAPSYWPEPTAGPTTAARGMKHMYGHLGIQSAGTTGLPAGGNAEGAPAEVLVTDASLNAPLCTADPVVQRGDVEPAELVAAPALAKTWSGEGAQGSWSGGGTGARGSPRRMKLLRAASTPVVRGPTARHARPSGRPPMEQLFNFSAMYTRGQSAVPGKSGAFGSTGWGGTIGIDKRPVQKTRGRQYWKPASYD
jgi:hypothetical protein